MRNTPLYPKYGTEDSHDFDPQLDFAVVGILYLSTYVEQFYRDFYLFFF